MPDRATIGNMAPEYGATMGFFPVDDKTIDYFKGTGRTKDEIERFEAYYKAQGLFGMPGAPGASQAAGEIEYTKVVKLHLGSVTPSLAGPKRPQDRIDLGQLSAKFRDLYSKPNEANGFNQPAEKLKARYTIEAHAPSLEKEMPDVTPGAPRPVEEMEANKPTMEAAHVAAFAPAAPPEPITVGNGDVLIAAITSCTNTSNPSVLLAAGLLAKKAVEAGLTVKPHIKTSLAPGSRIVTEYLEKAGLLKYLEKLGFYLAGYGCTTCIGNAGDLAPEINEAITENNLIAAAVLSGNRNFEARIHPNLKANFLASPPLVVAYAIAGNVMVDLMTQPVGKGKGGKDVFLGDIWPSAEEIDRNLSYAMNAKAFRANYDKVKTEPGTLWSSIEGVTGDVYNWPKSTYIAEPPFFEGFDMQPGQTEAGFEGARIMALFGDSITTDHISPAGSIKEDSPAGEYLKSHGVQKADFNSYGSRRGNHEVMMRGTFANVRIKNLMLPPGPDGSRIEGGYTLYQPGGEQMAIYDAAMKYMQQGVSTVVFGGEEYGTGSSRDWAAKGTQLLGIKAVIARSFERIHRANLVGMGVLPLQFKGTDSWQSLDLDGSEAVDVAIEGEVRPQMDVKLTIRRASGARRAIDVRLRIDTPIEVEYYKHGGILPFVLRQLLAA